MYAGGIAVPAPPPDGMRGKRTSGHLAAISADAQARLVLTDEQNRPTLAFLAPLPIVATDKALAIDGKNRPLPTIAPATLAYLQYTSGSTGNPKGVMISHANCIANLSEINHAIGYDSNGMSLTWLPHTHDFGLVEGLLRPLSAGVVCYIMSPWSFLRQPSRWLAAITRWRITHSSAPTFAYQYCVQRITPEQRISLDLRSWQVACIGAEPIDPQVLKIFNDVFGPYGFAPNTFCPSFGMAESTLMVTIKPRDHAITPRDILINGQAKLLTGCGASHGQSHFIIVDPNTHSPLPNGTIGEIWVAGPSVAQGYWQQPQATAEVFRARLNLQGYQPTASTLPRLDVTSHYLRTGDLGVIEDHQLFIRGRIKDLIIIHGQNYYPQDLETCIKTAHPILATGDQAAFTITQDTTERLALVCEIDHRASQTTDLTIIIQTIRNIIAAQFNLTVYAICLVRRGALPKTPSGKIQRRACQQAWLNGEFETLRAWQLAQETSETTTPVANATPTDDIEQQITEIWRQLLQVNQIHRDDNFFALGGDSLLAMRLMINIEQQFKLKISFKDFAFNPTITHLAAKLQQHKFTNSSFDLPLNMPEVETLSQAYDKIKETDQLDALENWKPPTLHSKLECFIQKLPLLLAMPLLRWLVQQPWIQQRYWADTVQLIRQFHNEIDTVIPIKMLIENSLFYGLLDKYGFAWKFSHTNHKPFWLRSFTKIEGLALLKETNQSPKGTVLAHYHLLASHWFYLKPFAKAEIASNIYAIGEEASRRITSIKNADTILYARQLEIARNTLLAGGRVNIAADGDRGSAREYKVIFHGHRRSFRGGFAELALLTDANVISVIGEMIPNKPIKLNFTNLLNKGDNSASYEQRVESLIDQYVTNLEQMWRTMPWMVPWSEMQNHIAYWPKINWDVNNELTDSFRAMLAVSHSTTKPENISLPLSRFSLAKEIYFLLSANKSNKHWDDPRYFAWLNSKADLSQAALPTDTPPFISNLAWYIYKHNPDLQQQFPNPLNTDRIAFVLWFITQAAQRFEIPEAFVTPMRDSFATWAQQTHPQKTQDARHLNLPMYLWQSRADLQQAFPQFANSAQLSDMLPFMLWFYERAAIEYGLSQTFIRTTTAPFLTWVNDIDERMPPLTRFAAWQWQSRADLQSAFPQPTAANFANYMQWLHEQHTAELMQATNI